MNQARSDTVQGLRELADWLEATPEALLDGYGVYVSSYGAAQDDVMALASVRGNTFEKQYSGNGFALKREFAGHVKYSLNTSREQVCTKRVVGQETVEVVDPNAPKVTVTRDVVEWDCHPLLAPSTS